MKTKWLNRTLILGPSICLCLSEEEYNVAKKHAKWPPDNDVWCNPGGGRVHMYLDCENPIAIVCLNHPEEPTVISIAGIIAHEATHIWQEHLRAMGEDSPGDEISAYAVQSLVVTLMDEWASRQ